MNRLKTILISAFLLLLTTVAAARDNNTLSLPDIAAWNGKAVRIPVNMDNSSVIVALQFDLIVPPGITVDSSDPATLTDRSANHTVMARNINDSTIRVISYSADNSSFRGNSGTIVYLNVMVPDRFEEGSTNPFRIADAVLSDPSADNVITSTSAGSLVIQKSPDLTVADIVADKAAIAPTDSFAIGWNVRNIGDYATTGGWREQIFLTNDFDTRLIATAYYESTLAAGVTAQRKALVALPDIPGIDGNVYVRVRVIPNADAGEPVSAQANNTGLSQTSITVAKHLTIDIPVDSITEGNGNYRCMLYRSGSRSKRQEFSLSLNPTDARVKLPASIFIESNSESAMFYMNVSDNDSLNVQDTVITVSAVGGDYESVTDSFTLYDDELPALRLSSVPDTVNEGDTFDIVLRLQRAPLSDLTVNIHSDHAKRFKYPTSVTLPANSDSLSVKVSVIDNIDLEGTRQAMFKFTAPGYLSADARVDITDNDVPAIGLSFTPAVVSEAAGYYATTARIERTDNFDRQVVLYLYDNKSGVLQYPSVVTLNSGEHSVDFNVGVIDDALVDGNDTVSVRAAVFLSACGCAAPEESVGSVSAKIVITDDDGPTVSVYAPTATWLEDTPAQRLVVKRNTPTDEPLTVSISSDTDDRLEYSHTVEIPRGASSVNVPVTLKPNASVGDSRTIVFSVEAENHNSGRCWVALSDRSLPDATVASVSLSSDSAEVNSPVIATVQIVNTGVIDLPAHTKVEVDINGTVAAAWTSAPIAPADTAATSVKITLPSIPARYNIEARINTDKKIEELSYVNNRSHRVAIQVLPAFVATITTDRSIYRLGDTIRLSGIASGSKAAGAKVDIYIMSTAMRQKITTTTDNRGAFSAQWIPQQYQAGHYGFNACYPGEQLTDVMAEADVIGLRRASTKPIYCSLTEGEAFEGTITLVNQSSVPFTDVKLQKGELPADFHFDIQVPTSITGRVDIPYTLTIDNPTQNREWQPIPFTITTAEGVSLDIIINAYCYRKTGTLSASVATIRTTMTKGKERDYRFSVTNIGKGESGTISLSLPEWIKPLTPSEMPSLQHGESAELILRLTPTDDMQINVPVKGNIGINCTNGDGVSIPFSIEPVSEAEGTFTVDVCDENTYFTAEAPHLQNANITLTHPTKGTVVAKGVTDVDGKFSVKLPEGYYSLSVTAEGHDSYRNNVLVDPGKETVKVVNLSIEAIEVQWDVEETEVEDEYEIKTTVKYETNVPVPVVEVNIPSRIEAASLANGESLIFNAILTNRGLIRAEEVTLELPSDFNTLEFEPLEQSQSLSLPPNQSVVIPVKVTKKPTLTPKTRASVRDANIDDDPCAAQVGTLYWWDCGMDRKWHRYEVAMQVGTCFSDDPSTWNPAQNPKDDTYGGVAPSVPGGVVVQPHVPVYTGYDSSSQNGYVSVMEDKGCEPCQNGVLTAILKCGGRFVGDLTETFETIQDLLTTNWGNIAEADIIEELKNSIDVKAVMKKIPYAKIAVTVAEEVQKCHLSTNMDGEQLYDCYKAASESLDVILDESLGAVIEDPIARKRFLKLIKKMNKWKSLIDNGVECAHDFAHACDHIKEDKEMAAMLSRAMGSESFITDFQQNMMFVESELSALSAYYDALLGENTEWDEVSLDDISALFEILQWKEITVDELEEWKPECLSDATLQAFVDHWNSMVNGSDLSSINKMYDAIATITSVNNRFIESGFTGTEDYISTTLPQVKKIVEEQSNSVCASIQLQLSQSMVLTRQAFRGTLTVVNGHTSLPMTDVSLSLSIIDEYGNIATEHEFSVQPETLTGFEGTLDLTAGWQLTADTEGKVEILFVPTKYAAPQIERVYRFGGTLTYTDPFTGLEVNRELSPVALTVNPSPDIALSYFMQRDIFGDDPLTEAVEPPVPAEFAVIVNNVGYGAARNVKMTTRRPEIIDNEKGTLIDFRLLSSVLNGKETSLPLDNAVTTDFGNIDAHSTAYAQWMLSSSLLGHFTDYDVDVKHITSNGNADLSLVSSAEIHELIHTVSTDTESGTVGFLTNDIADANDTPDHIYLSDGQVDDVAVASAQIERVNDTEYLLTLTPSVSGWNYCKILDPTAGSRDITSVVRVNNGANIDLRNIWLTDRTLPDGGDPIYEHLLHFADRITGREVYRITFAPKPDLLLSVEAIEGIAEDGVVTDPVNVVKVRFNKAIDPATFTTDDLRLTLQGRQLDLQHLTISSTDNILFTIDLSENTEANGCYLFTVQTADIVDAEGFSGKTGTQRQWTQYSGGTATISTSTHPAHAGEATPSSADYPLGSDATLTAVPSPGYTFKYWLCNGLQVSTAPTYTVPVDGDAEFVAEFTPANYKVQIEYDAQAGIISPVGSGTYGYGTELRLTATALFGWRFVGWQLGGKLVSSDRDLSVLITSDTTIQAIFADCHLAVEYNLQQGWNWITPVFADDDLLNPLQFIAPVSDAVTAIKGKSDMLTASDHGTLYGTLYRWSPAESYRLQSNRDATLAVNGVTAISDETPITLTPGWNYIGYLLNEPVALADAFTSFTPSDNDVVKGFDAFAIYSEGNWHGTLSTLTPLEGYMYRAASDGSFVYRTPQQSVPTPANRNAVTLNTPLPSSWTVDSRRYSDNHTMVTTLEADDADHYQIAAFIDGECRGIGTPIDHLTYLVVHGNDDDTDITFQAYNTLTGDIYNIIDEDNFSIGHSGTYREPFMLHLDGLHTSVDHTPTPATPILYPNPVKDYLYISPVTADNVLLTIFTLQGRKVISHPRYTTAEKIDVSHLPAGTYLIRLTTHDTTYTLRFIKL